MSTISNTWKIARDATAAAVYKLDQEFSKYTLDVFRNKFNETRNRDRLEPKQIPM